MELVTRGAWCLVKLPFVDRIQLQSNKFVTGVETKATGDSELYASQPAFNAMTSFFMLSFRNYCTLLTQSRF